MKWGDHTSQGGSEDGIRESAAAWRRSWSLFSLLPQLLSDPWGLGLRPGSPGQLLKGLTCKTSALGPTQLPHEEEVSVSVFLPTQRTGVYR